MQKKIKFLATWHIKIESKSVGPNSSPLEYVINNIQFPLLYFLYLHNYLEQNHLNPIFMHSL